MTTTKFNKFKPTIAEAFDIGRKEGLKEAFTEIKSIVSGTNDVESLKIYIEARLKSIQDFSLCNPFKQES